MTKISIFGKGNMGQAIGDNFVDSGHEVSYIQSKTAKTELGEIVILAVPYAALPKIIEQYQGELQDKVIVDITNPVDFDTLDNLLVPADSSAAAEIAEALPNAQIIKAFNTTFAATLATKKIGGEHQTTVLIAGDSQEAKNKLMEALKESGLGMLDVGSLKRARELEAYGFLQISLASKNKIPWTGGFGIFY